MEVEPEPPLKKSPVKSRELPAEEFTSVKVNAPFCTATEEAPAPGYSVEKCCPTPARPSKLKVPPFSVR